MSWRFRGLARRPPFYLYLPNKFIFIICKHTLTPNRARKKVFHCFSEYAHSFKDVAATSRAPTKLCRPDQNFLSANTACFAIQREMPSQGCHSKHKKYIYRRSIWINDELNFDDGWKWNILFLRHISSAQLFKLHSILTSNEVKIMFPKMYKCMLMIVETNQNCICKLTAIFANTFEEVFNV